MDEGDAKINSPKLFACPNEGCNRVYKRYGSMVNHVTYEKCEFQPERLERVFWRERLEKHTLQSHPS